MARILLLERDLARRTALERLLSNCGHEVRACDLDGLDACAGSATWLPDLVWLGNSVVHESSWAALRRLKMEQPSLRFLVSSDALSGPGGPQRADLWPCRVITELW